MTRHAKPRSWFAMFWKDLGWVSILLASATLFLTVVSVTHFAQARTVAQDGVPKFATVVDRRIEDGDTGRQYYVTYQFTIEGKKERIEMQVLPSVYADAANPFQKINYRTDNPEVIGARQAELQDKGRQQRNFALLTGVMGLLMGWLSGQNAMTAVLARRGGIEEDAYIFERVESHLARSSPRVHIKFRSHSGVEGKSFSYALSSFPAVDRGDMIRVFTLKGRAWWDHDTGPRAQMPRRLPIVQRMRNRLRRAAQR